MSAMTFESSIMKKKCIDIIPITWMLLNYLQTNYMEITTTKNEIITSQSVHNTSSGIVRRATKTALRKYLSTHVYFASTLMFTEDGLRQT